MIVDLLNRYLKILVLFVMLWTVIWSYGNVGCSKVEGGEMSPTISQGSFHLLLTEKRLPPEVVKSDVVVFRQHPGAGEQTRFSGKIYAEPGEIVWLERKIIGSHGQSDKSLEVRKESPAGADRARFIQIIVPRDSWFVVCENTEEYSLYDSRGRGPFGFWSVEGRLRR